ncbi:YkgJ family cysteine cluster protein [Methanocaldococcus indicus]|uniref:YkgJ family cysteine cluster protein n=1 Tax=Methanocaldococcus indicus TaxID=213231 RepID=UPI003C6CF0A0
MKWEITFNNRSYICNNCGYCCSCESWRIYLNYFDLLRLKDYKDYIEKTENSFFRYMLKINESGCSLLKNNLCRVHLEKGYEYKPLMCKIFPYSLMVKWDGTPLLIIKHYCNGIVREKPNKNEIKKVKEYIKELYFDSFEEFLELYSEKSSKTELYNGEFISWEEREELGRYIFNSNNFSEVLNKCYEIFGKNFQKIYNKFIYYYEDRLINKTILVEYLGEINKREHFRKLSLFDEVVKILDIGIYILKNFKNPLEGEKYMDKKLFLCKQLK